MQLGTVKTITEFVVSAGAGAIVSHAIKGAGKMPTSVIKRTTIGIGAFALSTFIGDITARHFTNQIDEAAEAVKTIRTEIDRVKKNVKDTEENGNTES